MSRRGRIGLLCLLGGLAPVAGAAEATSGALQPHTAVYAVTAKGVGVGEFELKLSPGAAPGSFRYETISYPNLIARWFVSADSREVSEFSVGAEGVVPSAYRFDDGASHKDDGALRYDWGASRVTGHDGPRPVNLPLHAGTQDIMSIRAAILVDLARGRTRVEYPMIDGDEVKTYVYRAVGHEAIDTPQGRFDTDVWVSARQGAPARERAWRFWYAPALGYLPVRAEQHEDGRLRLSFRLKSARLGAAP